MGKVLIFGGTTEGRALAEYCSRQGIPAAVSVATDYGEELLGGCPGAEILNGRLDRAAMTALLKEGTFDLVLDATHPFVAEVSANIAAACDSAGVPRVRVLRPAEETGMPHREETKQARAEMAAEESGAVVCVDSAAAAARYLLMTEGNVLLTTGSKELPDFADVPRERLFVRVLPSEDAVRLAKEAGIPSPHIIAMQGPFSEELNTALLRQYGCRYLVTKDSGRNGGTAEKLRAAAAAGAVTVLIGRPVKEEGVTLPEAYAILAGRATAAGPENCGAKIPGADSRGAEARIAEESGAGCGPEIVIAGIGPGSEALLTGEVREAILRADLLIGARRMVETALHIRKSAAGNARPEQKEDSTRTAPDAGASRKTPESLISWKADEIAARIRRAETEPGIRRICVLMSGDTGFFSGAEGVLAALSGEAQEDSAGNRDAGDRVSGNKGAAAENIRCLPGISSLSYLAARCGLPWQDVTPVSLHGRRDNWLAALLRTGAVFLVLSGRSDLDEAAALLVRAGLGDARIFCGEDLSSGHETITVSAASEWAFAAEGCPQGKLCAAIISLPGRRPGPLAPGIPDSVFQRAKVPLTKEEVRAVVMSKLKVARGAVCWDVGAGTGGVTAELSMAAETGRVFAVEKEADAAALLEENIRKLGLLNVTPVRGAAPEALKDLPAPDFAFVGGSSGNLKEILSSVYRKNPQARTAVTAVTLETAGELFGLLREYEAEGYGTDCVQLSVTGTRTAGSYRLLSAQNPVFIAVIRPEEGRNA